MTGFTFGVMAANVADWMVVVLGLGTVFVGLIAIIAICSITGAIFSVKKTPETANTEVSPATVVADEIPDRQQFIAAVSAAIAEDMGTDVSAIRIVSVEKV